MVDTTRYYFRENDRQKNQTIYMGSVISEGFTDNLSHAYATMARSRVKPLILAPTAATYVYKSYDFAPGHYSAWSNAYTNRTGSWLSVYPASSFVKRASWDSRANGQLATARLGSGSKFTERLGTFGESLSELTETGNMILSRARQIAQLAIYLKSGNWKGISEMTKGAVPGSVRRLPPSKRLANGWLELEFGWKPLVSDAYNAIEAYHDNVTKGMTVSSYRFEGRKKGRIAPSNGAQSRDWSDFKSRASSKQGGVVSNPKLFTLNALGLANPAKLAWDLLPFSFVADWFLPVAPTLAYMSNGLGLSRRWECNTSEYVKINTWSGTGGNKVDMTVTRAVTIPGIIPDLTTVSPRSLGIWHATTASALLSQVFGTRSGRR